MFFDIETVADPALLEQRQAFIDRKVGNIDRVNFLPEYNQICTIAVWRFNVDGQVVTKTLEGTEKEMIEKFYTYDQYVLTGFNILSFDLPFIIKRWLKYGLSVPPPLRIASEKPWTLAERFTDIARLYQATTLNMSSLEDLAMHLWIPTSKGVMHGSEVQWYYDTWQIDLITQYCREDVACTALIYQKLKSLDFF